jgi:hypothetical protein
LIDAAEARIGGFGNVEDRRKRLVERDPHVAVPFRRTVRGRLIARHRFARQLRDRNDVPVAIVFPAVIAADEIAAGAPSVRQLDRAMAAAILERCGLPVGVEEEHDVFAHEAERLRAATELRDGHRRVPEPAERTLLGGEHVTNGSPTPARLLAPFA